MTTRNAGARDTSNPGWLVHALLAIAIRAFPQDFRDTFGSGILETAHHDLFRARGHGRLKATRAVLATTWDLLRTGTQERLRPTWKKTSSFEHREREAGTMLRQWSKDLIYAARALARAPGFTVVTVLTLSLAIGSNVAIFSVVDAVLIDALPFANSDRLVSIHASAPGSDFPDEFGVSSEFLVQYREHATLLEDVALYNNFGATIETEEFADRIRMSTVSPSFFSTLGVTPLLGRLPGPGEQDDIVLISHALWVTRFGADSAILGRVLDIADEQRTVIGVMRPNFPLPEENTSIWIPYIVNLDEIVPGRFFWNLVARVVPGTTSQDLIMQLAPLARRLPERFGGSANYTRLIGQHQPVVRSLKDDLTGDVARPLWVLLGTVGVILLIACANVTNLFLVRSESRQQDLAVRQALGASRSRLVQSQMSEAVILAGLGGVGGVLLAIATVPVLLAAAPAGLPRIHSVSMDARSLAFAASIAFSTALFFGLIPAIRASSPSVTKNLRYAGRGTANTRQRHLGRDVLVVTQTALALVLLVGSGLLVRSFLALRDVDPGYDIEDIFTFQIAPSGDFPDGPSMARFHYEFMSQIAGLPGVQSVGVVNNLPLDEGTPSTTFVREETQTEGQTNPLVDYTYVGGDYFESMGIELLQGRLFNRSDHETNLGNALVSEAAAGLLWPGENPIGKRLRFLSDSTGWETVVGVVENIHQDDFREADAELIYLPLVGRSPRSWAVHSPGYVVKTPRAETIASEIRTLVRQTDPAAPMYAVHTMVSLAADSMVRLSFTALTLGLASVLALLLGAIGLYGVLSYVVAQRTQEIGLRMALGARDREVRWMVVQQGGRLALAGVVLGIIVALGVTRVLNSLLFGVQTFDLATFAGMSAMMLGVGFVASYVPARRACLVDPIKSLRAE